MNTQPNTIRLQVALDFLEMSRAMTVAEGAVAGGADILEVGTPLIKSEGLDAVRKLREAFPSATILAKWDSHGPYPFVLRLVEAGRVSFASYRGSGSIPVANAITAAMRNTNVGSN